VRAVLSTRDFSEGKYLVFATRKGMVKKTDFKSYNTPIKADGIIAIKIREGDELVEVRQRGGPDRGVARLQPHAAHANLRKAARAIAR
jgi:DNA gyrase subunit A